MSAVAVDEQREALERSREQGREELERAVSALATRTKQSLSPGAQAAKRPWLWLSVAAGVGMWLALRDGED